MPILAESFEKTLDYYRRLCGRRVASTVSAECNRVAGLHMFREWLAQADGDVFATALKLAKQHGEITAVDLAQAQNMLQPNASTRLKQLWAKTVLVFGREGQERIFLERRRVSTPHGAEYRYRLSELGEILMREACDDQL